MVIGRRTKLAPPKAGVPKRLMPRDSRVRGNDRRGRHASWINSLYRAFFTSGGVAASRPRDI